MGKIEMAAETVMSAAAREGVGVRVMCLLGDEDEDDNRYVEFGCLLRRDADIRDRGTDVDAFHVAAGRVEVRPTTLLGELFVSLLVAGG